MQLVLRKRGNAFLLLNCRDAKYARLGIKLETRQPDGQYTSEVFMLKQEPDSPATVAPAQEAPKDDVIWRRIRLPLTELDIYE